MKKKFIYQLLILVAVSSIYAACGKTDYPRFDAAYTGIYFKDDSIHYSFSVTPLTVERYVLNIPVKIMGAPTQAGREFKAEIISGKTTANGGEQYVLLTDRFIIMSDSINGVLPVEIVRSKLADSVWRLGLSLKISDDFQPTYEKKHEITVTFDNLVTPPDWKNYSGDPFWPSDLGPWNPNVWIKFMELFRKMEQIVPATYAGMIEKYGPNLEKDWPWDYQKSITKYIRIPLYDYFQQHPEYGAEIPKPY